MFNAIQPYLYHISVIIPITYMTLFHIMNPLGSAVLFYNLTPNSSNELRRKMALHISRNVFVILCITMLIGVYLLKLFGISIPVVKVCGGALILSMGWKALSREDSRDTGSAQANKELIKDELKHESVYLEQAFYPFAFPFTVGPGTIAVTLTISAESMRGDLNEKLFNISGAMISIILIAITIYLCYAYTDKVMDRMSRKARKAIMQLFSFVLICIGGQILFNGIVELMKWYK